MTFFKNLIWKWQRCVWPCLNICHANELCYGSEGVVHLHFAPAPHTATIGLSADGGAGGWQRKFSRSPAFLWIIAAIKRFGWSAPIASFSGQTPPHLHIGRFSGANDPPTLIAHGVVDAIGHQVPPVGLWWLLSPPGGTFSAIDRPPEWSRGKKRRNK